ncbi:trihelix transcription factor ASIL2 [Cornus florida]|uniref:trihelix transcription factor ASIL2 n=1 Tax=Cornus florida TaxID=4283 RepID=UPI0028970039|nr:trihelix transcription factor ASIL2 [Cornus florida]
MAAPSSLSTQDPPGPPPPSSSSSRRLPPPCWSHDETVALIDSYRDKWYSLRRGNLRANHWQEVAESVAARCPLSSGNPQKTSVQCRHKMEKLRKRYRSEVQRASSVPNGHRYSSSWVHFKRMESMEKGTSSAIDSVTVDHGAESEDDDDEKEYQGLYQNDVKHGVPLNRSNYGSVSNGIGGGGSGFRIRIPGRSGMVPTGTKIYRNFDENPNPIPNFVSTRVLRDGYSERLGSGKKEGGSGDGLGKKRAGDPVSEMVSAIKALGDGFVRMERMKMEMAREVETMRMEMELKRTEMILESQQRVVEAFAKAFSEKKKKAKRVPTAED